MTTTRQITTAEQLLEAGDIGRCELIRGELVMMTPAGGEHGDITNELAYHLTHHVKQHALGRVYAAETGFVIARTPDTVRAPDIAFIRHHRVPRPQTRDFISVSPDLAVEVISPSDRASEIQIKVQDWLAAGCALVWLVDPASRTITAYHPDGSAKALNIDAYLTGGDVIPGFELPVAEIFPPSEDHSR